MGTNMRKYQGTHPWLEFSLDLRKMSPAFWIMVGECQSKCEHISRVPLRPSTAEDLFQIYLAKGVQASTAIEGNTLTEEEVRAHLRGELKLPSSREYLSHEIDNIRQACNNILNCIKEGHSLQINTDQIKKLNKTVLENLKLKDDIIPGEFRNYSVGVGRYKCPPAEDCEHLIDKLCTWLSGDDFKAPAGLEIGYAIIKSIVAHLYFAWIHPFGDGNGRTARLLELQILISSGVAAVSAHLLSDFYNQTRNEYYLQLDDASKKESPNEFLEYAVKGFLEGLKQQLEVIWRQQWDIVWRNYIDEYFRDRNSLPEIRRKILVLGLSLASKPLSITEITDISPRVAREYARLTDKSLRRDLNLLIKEKLVEKTKDGYRARTEVIFSFISPIISNK
jgi:cell filamentation protein, protein adenylyltransferase